MAGLVGLVALVGAAAGGGGTGAVLGGTGGPTAAAAASIPAPYLALYQAAAATCPGLPWTVLAAIGTVESDNGQSTLPGVHSGVNEAGVAEGPMQFEVATFAEYDEPVPPGGATPPSPYDPTDGIYAAARLLCANGAANGTDIPRAVERYNHTSAYVADVLSLAATYGETTTSLTTLAASNGEAATAIAYAERQLGTPYVWGGETPGVGFDCSGLVQAAYRAAGVDLPRVAQTQFDAGPAVPPETPLEAGDLMFFGTGPADVTHVGIYLGVGQMIDAPYTGSVVRIDEVPTTPGAPWGGERFLGATRPVEQPGPKPTVRTDRRDQEGLPDAGQRGRQIPNAGTTRRTGFERSR